MYVMILMMGTYTLFSILYLFIVIKSFIDDFRKQKKRGYKIAPDHSSLFVLKKGEKGEFSIAGRKNDFSFHEDEEDSSSKDSPLK